MLQQVFQALAGAAQAQGVAAGEVIVDIARGLVLKGLRQAQVALHQQIGPLQGALRPPERRAQSQANGDQKEGVQIRQQLQAHAWFNRQQK
uniref:Putative methyl-accepting chemotaxis protein n=1 Tax=Phakopsora pachyrhizi TaxID=170000 RepID=A0A0S1MKJ3_PHAPC